MSENRQRWRVIFERHAEAAHLPHREVAAAWESNLRASGLPLSFSESAAPKARIAFAAPVPVGWLAERELLDVFLVKHLRLAEVREALERSVPQGHALAGLYDVWVGGPASAALVTASDVLVAIVGAEAAEAIAPPAVGLAIQGMLDAPRIERRVDKGGVQVTADIRPRFALLRAEPPLEDGSFGLWMRLRHLAEGGVGRPEEIVDALCDALGRPLKIGSIVRERLHLLDDRDA